MMRFAIGALALACSSVALAADPNEELEKAIRDAVSKAAPSVVRIETTGGTETIGGAVRKGVGPMTGLIVSADGYVVSSAFNFANKPSAINVTVANQPNRFPAKIVATDQTRMVTLLKIDASGLVVPSAVPRKDITVGQWAIALGRTLDNNINNPPSVSVGIISATNRIWSKCIQTDAKVSPVNYGGPLIDGVGRVHGLLIPASPSGEGESSGVDWYDSGIGFAVPLEDILTVLPKLKQGKDLVKGTLGVTLKGSDRFGLPCTLDSISPESPAAKAGLQSGDVIVEVDGRPISSQAQFQHAIGPKYDGDTVTLKVKRGNEIIEVEKIVLSRSVVIYAHPFLGLLPMRDDPALGVEVRYVYPQSPAEKAGVKPGDRILSIGPANATELAPFSGRDALLDILNRLRPGMEIKIGVKRKDSGKSETVTLKLTTLPTEVPADLPEKASVNKALAPREAPPKPVGPGPLPKPMPKEQPPEAKKPVANAETGLLKRTNAALGREYWLYVPKNYDPNTSYALLIWLHGAGNAARDAQEFSELWHDFCTKNRIIILGPRSTNADGWLPSETEFIIQHVQDVTQEYSIDRQRIIVHGATGSGSMAYYVGFAAREQVRGVAVSAAPLSVQPRDNVPTQRLAFFLVAGGKDPSAKDISEGSQALTEKKFPVTFREVPAMGKEYLDDKTLGELVRWIDSLDRF